MRSKKPKEWEKQEHRQALKADLRALWISIESQLTEDERTRAAPLIKDIDGLLKGGGDDFTWVQCNAAELLMLPLLPDPVLDAQFRHSLAEARQNGMPMGDHHSEMIRRFLTSDPSDKTMPKPERSAKQEAYRTLLTEVHQYYLNRRFRRDLRLRTAQKLLYFVGVILFLAVLPVLLFALAPGDAATSTTAWSGWRCLAEKAALVKDPIFCGGAAAAFGILGAFFSRLVSFQSRQQTYGFDELLHNFSERFVAVRCAVGMFGAIILYLLMRSGLLGGSLFLTDVDYADPVKAFAKILVWSFVAGWSERLVPEALERVESSSKPAPKDASGKAG
jgi:hypothetical protein